MADESTTNKYSYIQQFIDYFKMLLEILRQLFNVFKTAE